MYKRQEGLVEMDENQKPFYTMITMILPQTEKKLVIISGVTVDWKGAA